MPIPLLISMIFMWEHMLNMMVIKKVFMAVSIWIKLLIISFLEIKLPLFISKKEIKL
jgi:hypothetical protein